MFKNYKNLFVIFSLFFILILSLGLISASEDIGDQLNAVDSSIDDDMGIAYEIDSSNEINGYENNVDLGIDENEQGGNDLSEETPYNTITLNGGTFEDIQRAVDDSNDGDTIELIGTFYSTGNMIEVNKKLTFQGAQDTVIDGKNLSDIFKVKSNPIYTSLADGTTHIEAVTFKDMTFINSNGSCIDPAIDPEEPHRLGPDLFFCYNCTFENNTANMGAISFGAAINCTFKTNKMEPKKKESVDWVPKDCERLEHPLSDYRVCSAILWGHANNCTFINNGCPLYWCEVLNCTFLNEDLVHADELINCTLINTKHSGSGENCIYENSSQGAGEAINCTFNNYDGSDYVCGYYAVNCSFINITTTYSAVVEGDYFMNCSFVNTTSKYSTIINHMSLPEVIDCTFENNVHDYACEVAGVYYSIWDDLDVTTVYNSGEKFTINLPSELEGFKLIVSAANYNKTFKINQGKVVFSLDGLAPGKYDVKVELPRQMVESDVLEIYDTVYQYSKFTIKKATPKLTASAVTTVYNGGKYLIASFKDAKGAIKNAQVTITLNGKKYTRTTDSKGQVKLSTNGLAPKTYTASIVFAGNKYYNRLSQGVKVTVKKANPKLTASAKTFKLSKKTKSYSVTLKTNQNKVLKKAKISLKVNGKTYTAKTDSKGKASFKITNLKKKGTYKAKVNFAGDKYYNKISKTVKITVKK